MKKTILFIVLMSVVFSSSALAASKDTIVKRVVVGFEKRTVEYYGGMERCKKMLKRQFETVDRRINDPDVFDFCVKSVFDTIFEYSGNADDMVRSRKEVRPYDIRIFYDGFASIDNGGWYGGPYFTITHKWSVDKDQGPFSGYATDGIVHEYGHTMLMYDLYATEIHTLKNLVNGQEYKAPKSIMNYAYGNRTWDPLSIFVLNANRHGQKPGFNPMMSYFPPLISIKVVNAKGVGIDGAQVSLYAGKWYGNNIAMNPEITGVSDQAGVFMLDGNPFVSNGHYKFPIFLVEVVRGSRKYYEWLPMYDVQLAWVEGAKDAYEKVIVVNK